MNIKNKKIGIWGFGVVGKSALAYLRTLTPHLEVFDNNPLPPESITLLDGIPVAPDLKTFLEQNDFIVPSPGIDLYPHAHYSHKWLSELDLFAHANTGITVAVTGTSGKTSVTQLLGQLINAHGIQCAVGGNIGTGMLELLRNKSDMTLLELSSFQLELNKSFAPDLAIWTNFSPNHLDRHGKLESYFEAKYKMLAYQNSEQQALLPWSLRDQLKKYNPSSALNFFTTHTLTPEQLGAVDTQERVYFIKDGVIVEYHNQTTTQLMHVDTLPKISFLDNWVLICAALHLLNIPTTAIAQATANLQLPEHRLEHVATIRGIDFYNDSKSTTPTSTFAAIAQLQARPIHLFLGGISKGIDRSDLIKNIKGKVVHVYCFGKEAEILYDLCLTHGIPSSAYATLETAVADCIKNMHSGDQLLFSPAGASFDLFKNYEERGKIFKALVNSYR